MTSAPAVGATYCVDRLYEGYDTLCIHNPATGREATMPHVVAVPTARAGKIAIVGAAPPGLKPRACRRRAVTTSLSSRPPPIPAGKSGLQPRSRAGESSSASPIGVPSNVSGLASP